MAARRKATKKAETKRVAKRRAARKVAKRVVTKRAARKVAKRVVTKRAARKVAKRVVTKRAARKVAKRAAKQRPARKVAKRATPSAFAPQKAGASAKDLLLFDIERARVAVLAAIQGLGAGTAMQPVAPGKWSIHEIVLHLAVRDRVRLDEFDSMLAGSAGSWAGIEDLADQATMNEADLVPLRQLSWDEAIRLLMTTRAELEGRLQAVPAEPAGVWSESHAFGAMMQRLPLHDRGHAEAIKNARITG